MMSIIHRQCHPLLYPHQYIFERCTNTHKRLAFPSSSSLVLSRNRRKRSRKGRKRKWIKSLCSVVVLFVVIITRVHCYSCRMRKAEVKVEEETMKRKATIELKGKIMWSANRSHKKLFLKNNQLVRSQKYPQVEFFLLQKKLKFH